MKTAKRAIVYIRVSSKANETKSQEKGLIKYCEQKGYKIIETIIDKESGIKNQETIKLLYDKAIKRQYEILVVDSISRISRQGVYKTLEILNNLSKYKVKYDSRSEPYLSSIEDNPFGEFIVSIHSFYYRFEREVINERIRRGKQNSTKKQGRKELNIEKQIRIKELSKKGLSNRKIAKTLKLSHKTVGKYIK